MNPLKERKKQTESKRKLPVIIEPYHIQLFKDCTLRHAQRLHKQYKEDLDKEGKYAVLTLSELCDIYGITEEEFAQGIKYNMLPPSEQF